MNELNNFTRLFKNVKNCKNLCWQEKAILSEIISYQLDGKSFKLKDLTLALELGMDKGTISKLINRLYKRGVIDKVTVSFASLSGGKPKRQRTVTVNEITKWTTGNVIPEVKTIEPKPKKTPNAIEPVETIIETPVIFTALPSIEQQTTEPEAKPSIKPKKVVKEQSLEEMLHEAESKNVVATTSTKKSSVKTNDVITLDAIKDIDNTPTIGKIIIAQLKQNKEVKFVNVLVKFGDELLPDEATLIPNGSNKYFPKSTLKIMDASVFE